MKDIINQAPNLGNISAKVARLFQKRTQLAQDRFNNRVQQAYQEQITDLFSNPMALWNIWMNWLQYSTDFAQRSILFLDTLRQRGNNFVEHERAGKPPVLNFEYEIVLDGRTFERPVNYAMVRIIPPKGMAVDPKRRPYVIIDPRAGHGPGVGGVKDDSQVGVALREKHPVYFVIFFPTPEPGQTLLDVCEAEKRFLHKVRELHADSPKPILVGNCQGGWSTMMLAASDPDNAGPIVINGAPMSYWSGAWRPGEGDNPMRYIGGLLGGSWLASFAADMGNGLFDGAYLVENMENLNPANTFWDKYYNLFAKVDTEAPRFLDFERWWGGFYLFNREEIEWIVRELFVGNKIWKGSEGDGKSKAAFDLRNIKSPIILFASLGDNITPPQQAFNWVADIYGSTDEIKANGQTIVGLLHQDIGHLGIFVSGRVAKKEHAQIVEVMKSIEALPPGLYGMKIKETKSDGGKVVYEVEFVEHQLEEVTQRLNRFKRADETPFKAVAAVAELNQRAYETFARPMVQAFSNDMTAELGRRVHPLRFQRWALSDQNPWLAWLKPAADLAKQHRQPTDPDQPFRRAETAISELVSASLDLYRDIRDAISEASFFELYGGIFSIWAPQLGGTEEKEAPTPPQELPFVKELLASADQGGYPEALARIAGLLVQRGQPIPLSRFELKEELLTEYRDLLPDIPRDQMRRIRGEQEIIIRYDPAKAIETLPQLVQNKDDRVKLLQVFDLLLSDKRVQAYGITPEQRAMMKKISTALSIKPEEMPHMSGMEVLA